MEIQEIISKALGNDLDAYAKLNQKQALFLPMTKEEEKQLADFRKKIVAVKSTEERAPKLAEFVTLAKKLQEENGFKMSEIMAALKGEGSKGEVVKIGTFALADYKFKAVDNKGKEVLVDNKPITHFDWNNGDKLGPGWKSKFVAAIRAGGLTKAEKHFTPEFAAWLEVGRPNQRSKEAGAMIFENKRAFYKTFGLEEDGKTKIGAGKKKAA